MTTEKVNDAVTCCTIGTVPIWLLFVPSKNEIMDVLAYSLTHSLIFPGMNGLSFFRSPHYS